jgi:hypothetical protein
MPFKFDADYLDTPSGIMGGFDRVAYLALVDWIVGWPELTQNPKTDAELVTLTGEFVMAPDAAFIKISGRSGLTSDSQGERDCTSVKNSGQLFRAGTHTENIALHRKLNDACGVIIFTDGPRGDDRAVVGDKLRPCRFTAKVDYGTSAADSKGVTISYEADGFVAGYKYAGNIPTRVVDEGISISYTFIGVVGTAYPTEKDIRQLPAFRFSNTDVVHSFTTVHQWVIICEPAEFDPFIEVIDQYGFDKTNSFRISNIAINGVPYRFMMYAPPLSTTESNKTFTFKK